MKRKLIALALVLCMAVSLAPQLSLPARAAATTNYEAYYDMNWGSVFWAKGADTPELDGECFLCDGHSAGPVSKTKAIHFLLDPDWSADWELWNQDETLSLRPVELQDDSAVFARVSWETADGLFDEVVVNHDQASYPGFSYEDNVLSFTPGEAVVGNVRLNVFWSEQDFAYYDSFRPTEEKPVMVELHWNGSGELQLPADLDPADCLVQTGRARVRLPETAQSLSVSWTGHLHRIFGDGLGENGDWGEVCEPGGSEYACLLNLTDGNGDPLQHYNFDFEFVEDWNYLFAANYNPSYGLVFQAVGSDSPWCNYDQFLPPQGMGRDDWPDNVSFEQDGQPAAIHLWLEPSLGLDHEEWWNGGFNLWDAEQAEDRAISVVAKYKDENAQWHEDVLLEKDVLVSADASYDENGVLSFTPPCGFGVDFDVYWTESEYDFANFGATETAPVVVEISWNGDNVPILEDNLSEDDRIELDNRMRVRVADSVESLSFTWEEEPPLRQIRVDGLGEDGGWLEDIVPEENSYCLSLDQSWSDGSPRTWYNISFEFENNPMAEEGTIWINYNDARGSAFYAFGFESEPASTADYYWHSGYDYRDWVPHNEDDYPETVRLLVNENLAIDGGAWDQNGELVLRQADHVQNRGVYISVRSNWANGLVVENNCLTELGEYKGFFWQYNVEAGVSELVFSPRNDSDVELNLSWSAEEWNIENFQPTEEAPVMIDVNWWGSGTPILPEVNENDVRVTDGHAKIRVSEDTESLSFSWDESECELRQINVQGLGENGDWLNDAPFSGSSYTLMLDQVREDGSPENWYQIQFEFEGGVDRNGMLRVFYDNYLGSVFRAFEGETPEAGAAYYQFEGWEGEVSFLDDYNDPRYISLLLDPGTALDWDAWNDTGELSFYDNHEVDLVPYVKVVTNSWQGWVVEMNQLTGVGEAHDFSYDEDTGILSFFPQSSDSVEIKVFWTGFDAEYESFRPNRDYPILVEVHWWGDNEVLMPDAQAANLRWGRGKGKVRLPADAESLLLEWGEGPALRQINVDGLGEDGGWAYDVPFDEDGYLLLLNQTDDNGERRTWYNVDFEFEGNPGGGMGWNGDAASYYDQSKGSVFYALGDDTPAADAAHYLDTDWQNGFHFMAQDGNQTVHLLFDETLGLDWDRYNENGEIAFVDAPTLEARNIIVYYQSNDYDGVVFAGGEIAEVGQWLGFEWNAETGILSFLPPSDSDFILRIYWTEADAEFDAFQPTEDYPIMVECEWWNDGEILLPENVGEVFTQDGRARIRVPEDTESLTFTWAEDYGVQMIHLEGAGEDGDWLHIAWDQAEPHAYTLQLNLTDENGDPFHWYHINFDFFPNSDYQLWVNWSGSEGNVFFGLGEAPPLDEAHYIQDPPSFRAEDENGDPVPGTVFLTLDPTHSIAYFGDGIQFWELPEYDYDPFIWVEYPHDDGSWFEGMVVEHGAATQAGFSFENNTLCFTPENKQPVIVHIFWNQADLDYWNFDGTEDKPVVVELWRGGGAPVRLPADIPAEDIHIWEACEHIFTKIRLPADRESLRISWDREAQIQLLEVEGAGENGERLELNFPAGTWYDLMLDQTENGQPRMHYGVTVWALELPESPFTDVPQNAWYSSAVNLCTYLGFSAGTSATTFSPNAKVTRAQMMTFLWRAAGSPEPTSEDNPFTDVPADSYYCQAVLWAVESGITCGTSADRFSPGAVCTRAQAVTFLHHAAPQLCGLSQEDPGAETAFVDVPEDAYYALPARWAAYYGITAGTSAGRFSPNQPCTRAQAMVMLYRCLICG